MMLWPFVTAVLAAVAAVINATIAVRLWRTRTVGTTPWAIWHTVTAAGAAFYAAMFAEVVFVDDLNRAAWSERLTPTSAVSFFVVWTIPAVIHIVTRPDR